MIEILMMIMVFIMAITRYNTDTFKIEQELKGIRIALEKINDKLGK